MQCIINVHLFTVCGRQNINERCVLLCNNVLTVYYYVSCFHSALVFLERTYQLDVLDIILHGFLLCHVSQRAPCIPGNTKS